MCALCRCAREARAVLILMGRNELIFHEIEKRSNLILTSCGALSFYTKEREIMCNIHCIYIYVTAVNGNATCYENRANIENTWSDYMYSMELKWNGNICLPVGHVHTYFTF